MGDSDYRRQNDQIVPRIEQKLDDFLLRWDDHLAWSKKVSEDHDRRIRELEQMFKGIEKPVKLVGWTVTIFMSGVLLYFGDGFARWVWRHWNP